MYLRAMLGNVGVYSGGRVTRTITGPHEFDLVWYSPERDELRVAKVGDGCLFYDEHGPFHVCFGYDLRNFSFYLVGAL